ncbi:hypothetical protein K2173_016809 [Erythroxylum novogranatense]|uniref:Biogenesis of lysosome-related organelles complex 1 subunit 7 n=1 Tax=Erythroxylum novogranatense TaxID=1862640 RepID=A0AAV8STB7_9ROSI|nr:hypothetical protein K2173_016809 [Erythroxylum novogranatense]
MYSSMKWQSESDNLNMNDDHHSGNKSSDAVGKGLYTILACGMRDFDSKAHQTHDSQHHLLSALDRLTQELDQLLEDAPLPFIMQHAAKISGVRKRVSYLNSLLTSIQHRLDNMDQLLSAQGKTTSDNS